MNRILKMKLTGLAGKKGRVALEGIKDDGWVLGLSKWMNGGAMY